MISWWRSRRSTSITAGRSAASPRSRAARKPVRSSTRSAWAPNERGKSDEVRVGELGVDGAALAVPLLGALDRRQGTVVDDHRNHVDTVADRGGQLEAPHQETAVTAEADHRPLRMGGLGAQSCGKGVSQGDPYAGIDEGLRVGDRILGEDGVSDAVHVDRENALLRQHLPVTRAAAAAAAALQNAPATPRAGRSTGRLGGRRLRPVPRRLARRSPGTPASHSYSRPISLSSGSSCSSGRGNSRVQLAVSIEVKRQPTATVQSAAARACWPR